MIKTLLDFTNMLNMNIDKKPNSLNCLPKLEKHNH